MTTTGVGFRWLDILEKEFDLAYVGLDTSIAEIDADDPEIAYSIRQKMTTLSSCFAQLSHKAQTIFQNSAKVEAELVDLRTKLVDAQVLVDSSQRNVAHDEPASASAPDRDSCSEARVRAECAQFARENAALRDTVLMLHGDLYGARLAAKYLDKELAGRIQQLQLLGREMRGAVRDRLWRQLEAEILLQRHKNVVRACRLANTLGLARPAAGGLRAGSATGGRGVGEPRVVLVKRTPHQGLGISITGGREHGVPILISELEAGGPAAATGALYVGDAILAVNQVDLRQCCHREAVRALQAASGDCALAVQFVADEDSDDDAQHSYSMHYPLFPVEGEPGDVPVTPTAPRTPLHSPTARLRRRWDSRSEEYSERLSPGMNAEPSHFVQTSRPDLAYQEYSGLHPQGHHPILDMDDNNIKIQTDIDSAMLNVQNCHHYDCAEGETHPKLQQDDNFNGLTIVSLDSSITSESPSRREKDVEQSRPGVQNSNRVSDETVLSVDRVGMEPNGRPDDSPSNGVRNDVYQHRNENFLHDENKISAEDLYDRNSENIGFLYPKLGSLQHFGVGNYRGLVPEFYNSVGISSSNENSLENTPVHRRSRASRKKPGDWKSKGAYRPVHHTSTDADSPPPSPSAIRKRKLDTSYRRDSADEKGGVKTLQHIFSRAGVVDPVRIESDDETNISLLPNSQLSVRNGIRENSFKYVEPILVNKVDINVESLDIHTDICTQQSSTNVEPGESHHCPQQTDDGVTPSSGMLATESGTGIHSEEKSTSQLGDCDTSDRNEPLQRDCIRQNEVNDIATTTSSAVNVRSRAFRIGGAKRIPPPPDFVHIPLKNSLHDERRTSTATEESSGKTVGDVQMITLEPKPIASTNDIQNFNGSELSNSIYKSIDSKKDDCTDDSLKRALSKLELSVCSGRAPHATHATHASHASHASHLIHGDGDPQFGTPV